MKSKDIDHISQVNKSLHVLIIAYACEPDRGSEPGTGWNVALGLSAFHRVTVATRANNRASIEKFINNYSGSKPEFIYIDPPNWALCLKRYNVMPVQFFYLLWHLYLKKELSCKNISFDIIHQLTFNSFEIPPLVFNSLRGIKIWGPIGGGQTVVLGALRAFGLSGFFKEALRNLRVKLSRYAPWTRTTLCSSDLVLFANPETKNLLSAAFSSNTGMMIDVGVNCDAFHPPIRRADSSKIILLTAGRLESRKGTILLIKAFHKLRDQYPNMELRIVGCFDE
jgi:glycosyltransferase involved in cell wall biosynthesis